MSTNRTRPLTLNFYYYEEKPYYGICPDVLLGQFESAERKGFDAHGGDAEGAGYGLARRRADSNRLH